MRGFFLGVVLAQCAGPMLQQREVLTTRSPLMIPMVSSSIMENRSSTSKVQSQKTASILLSEQLWQFSKPLSFKEREIWERLTLLPNPNEEEEALVVLGLLRWVVQERGKLNLEIASQGLPYVSLLKTLSKNPFLRKPVLKPLLKEALRNSSQDYQKAVWIAYGLKNSEPEWVSPQEKSLPLEHKIEKKSENTPTIEVTTKLESESTVETQEIPIINQVPNVASWDRVEEHIHRHEFREAIAILKSMEKEEEITKKIRDISNEGVKNLRKQAAEAYQKTLHSQDFSQCEAWLKEAKKVLEEAVENFPEAENLETVQANLKVIEQRLAQIRGVHGSH